MLVGSVKSISGAATIKDINGDEMLLSLQSVLKLGDTIQTSSEGDSVQIVLNSGKTLELSGFDTLKLDSSVTQTSSFEDEAVFDMQSLQALLVQSKIAMQEDSQELKETFMLETSSLDTTNAVNLNSDEKVKEPSIALSATQVLSDKDQISDEVPLPQEKASHGLVQASTKDLSQADLDLASQNPCLIDISEENLI